jgi:predicted ATPase
LARIDEALTLVGETGEHWTDGLLHRIRGEILLKRNLHDIAPTEEALLTAIAIAQQQKARSFELRAAMSMVRLWGGIRANGRRPASFSLRSTASSVKNVSER